MHKDDSKKHWYTLSHKEEAIESVCFIDWETTMERSETFRWNHFVNDFTDRISLSVFLFTRNCTEVILDRERKGVVRSIVRRRRTHLMDRFGVFRHTGLHLIIGHVRHLFDLADAFKERFARCLIKDGHSKNVRLSIATENTQGIADLSDRMDSAHLLFSFVRISSLAVWRVRVEKFHLTKKSLAMSSTALVVASR